MGNLALMAVGLLVVAAFTSNHNDTPTQRIAAAQAQVNKAADAATPDVMVFAGAIQKQVEAVNKDAENGFQAAAEPAETVQVAQVEHQAWMDNSSFKNCKPHGDPAWHNIVCY